MSAATAGVPIGDGRARAGLCAPADRRAEDVRRLPGVGPAGGGVSGGTGVVLLGDGGARAGLGTSMYTAVQYSSVHSHVCVYTHSCVHKVMATTVPKIRYKYRVPDELAP